MPYGPSEDAHGAGARQLMKGRRGTGWLWMTSSTAARATIRCGLGAAATVAGSSSLA
jgi:hypothetical protein